MSTTTRTFTYRARGADGSVATGRVEAPHQMAVANRLRDMGVSPLEITEVSATGLRAEVRLPGRRERITPKDVAVLCRQLATMVGAGLTLLRSLSILEEQTASKPLARVVRTVRGEVESGTALSVALGQHPTAFPPLLVNLVRAGEVGGFLDGALRSVARTLENELKLRAKVKGAMTYPVVVFVVAVLAVIGMLVFIVPVFATMFAQLGGQLPLPTRVLVVLSDGLKVAAAPLVAAGLVVSAVWRRHRHAPAVRERLDPVLLRLPVFGELLRKIAVARFCRNLGTMLGSGVPLLQALEIVGQTSGSTVVERAVRSVQDAVRHGRSLAGPLAEHRVFPPMVVQMMAVGEDTGALDEMLEKVADFYDDEVTATTEALTSLIEPLMIVVLGGLIGGMIVALYMPIFSVFTLIE